MAARAAVVAPARRAAFDVLLRVFEDGAYADRALRGAVGGLDERDRALAHQLAFGTVQRARTLDHAIETLGKRPVRRLDPPVRAALRLGTYQLVFLGGVPRYAAVNESVELVRRAGLERAVPFTNAVLRRLADGARALVEALPEETAADAALRHSYPDWIAETWWRDLGRDDGLALLRAQNEPAETAVRLVSGAIEGTPDAEIPGAWIVDRVDEDALAEGRIWPQSRGSQLAGLAGGARDGERVLDL
jgi:16S rRNA (cytosine967-C5)-methyltransferase